jgi:DNA-binding PadR family transcriptional regulator
MRYPFLALLARSPSHGYELKQAFEETFGDVWPELNFGQIYTTLARLERDGLVVSHDVPQEHRKDKRVYEVTPEGRDALREWLQAPIEGPWVKDDFFLKLVMARLTGTDERELIEKQRRVYLQALHELSEVSGRRQAQGDLIPALLVEGAMLHLEADLEWLDRCEDMLAGRAKGV